MTYDLLNDNQFKNKYAKNHLILNFEETNFYICIRKYIQIKCKKFFWYHANSPVTIELVCKRF